MTLKEFSELCTAERICYNVMIGESITHSEPGEMFIFDWTDEFHKLMESIGRRNMYIDKGAVVDSFTSTVCNGNPELFVSIRIMDSNEKERGNNGKLH